MTCMLYMCIKVKVYESLMNIYLFLIIFALFSFYLKIQLKNNNTVTISSYFYFLLFYFSGWILAFVNYFLFLVLDKEEIE